jgi:glycosyltransferase involved in cell wall biosynthesis
LIEAAFAIPGDLDSPTGGYAYARRVIAEGPGVGVRLSVVPLPGDFPFPSAGSVEATARTLAAVPPGMPLLVDGLAFGALPVAALAGVRAPIAVLLHHPLGLETGMTAEVSAKLIASEGAALRHARAVVVPSRSTRADVMRLFGTPAEAITVSEPGLDKPAGATARRAAGEAVILSVASLSPRKGHDVLIDALARIADRPWRAIVSGADDRDATWAGALRARIEAAGLGGRISLRGAVSRTDLDSLYAEADVFCLPSRHEGYGMVFAEAMAHGLPVVAARIPAAEEVVPAAAGILVPRDDAAALARALASLLDDRALARRMGEAALAHAATLHGWDETARRIGAVLAGLTRETAE